MTGSRIAALAAVALALGFGSAAPCKNHSDPPFTLNATASAPFPLLTGTAALSLRTDTGRAVVAASGSIGSSAVPSSSYAISGSSIITSSSSSGVSSSTDAPSSSTTDDSSSTPAGPPVLPTTEVPASSSSGSTSSPGSSSADCTFTSFDDVADGQKGCSSLTISGMSVPAGETLDLTNVADDTTIYFEGTTTFAYSEWEGPLLAIGGTNIQVIGNNGNKLDGNGAQYWDGEGSNGGATKPKFFAAHSLTDSSISGLNFYNAPVQLISINSASNLTVSNILYDNSAGDGDNGGHNTDAFDVGSSTGVLIQGCTVHNQDDCLAVNSGSDITFDNNYCSGGHGISIGSVGGRDDNAVSDVTISNSQVVDSDNGVRIKTVSGATGSVKGVTYSNITMSGIAKYGIVIEQDYENGSPTGTPTDGVPITDVTLDGVTGTVSSDADNIYILCASCSDWTWAGVDITGGKTDAACEGVPTGASC